jgi:hypothetical protein
MNDSCGFFTLTELQERLNKADRRRLLHSIWEHEIPYTMIGTETFITNDDFVTWLKEHRQVGNPRKRNAAKGASHGE